MNLDYLGLNPYLEDYKVRSPGRPKRPAHEQNQAGRASAEGNRATAYSAENGGPPEPPPPSTRDTSTTPLWIKYALVMVLGAVAAELTTNTLSFLRSKYENRLNDPPAISAPTTSDELFAIQVQVRGSMEEARNYLNAENPLLAVLEDWNSPEGLFRHGNLPHTLPALIPEARPGREAVFNKLVFDGLRKVQVHAFEYLSEDQLYKVSYKCGLPSRVGVRWIKQWSSWRQYSDSSEKSRCEPGGWCILLTRGCDADTFNGPVKQGD